MLIQRYHVDHSCVAGIKNKKSGVKSGETAPFELGFLEARTENAAQRPQSGKEQQSAHFFEVIMDALPRNRFRIQIQGFLPYYNFGGGHCERSKLN